MYYIVLLYYVWFAQLRHLCTVTFKFWECIDSSTFRSRGDAKHSCRQCGTPFTVDSAAQLQLGWRELTVMHPIWANLHSEQCIWSGCIKIQNVCLEPQVVGSVWNVPAMTVSVEPKKDASGKWLRPFAGGVGNNAHKTLHSDLEKRQALDKLSVTFELLSTRHKVPLWGIQRHVDPLEFNINSLKCTKIYIYMNSLKKTCRPIGSKDM